MEMQQKAAKAQQKAAKVHSLLPRANTAKCSKRYSCCPVQAQRKQFRAAVFTAVFTAVLLTVVAELIGGLPEHGLRHGGAKEMRCSPVYSTCMSCRRT